MALHSNDTNIRDKLSDPRAQSQQSIGTIIGSHVQMTDSCTRSYFAPSQLCDDYHDISKNIRAGSLLNSELQGSHLSQGGSQYYQPAPVPLGSLQLQQDLSQVFSPASLQSPPWKPVEEDGCFHPTMAQHLWASKLSVADASGEDHKAFLLEDLLDLDFGPSPSFQSPSTLGVEDEHSLHEPMQKLHIDIGFVPPAPHISGSPLSEEAPTTTSAPSSSIKTIFSFHQPEETVQDVERKFQDFALTLKSRFPDLHIMPQDSYKSHAKADHNRYVKDANLQPMIEFNLEPYPCGVPLQDALSGRLKDLADDLVLNHGPPSAYIRLQVPGYKSKREQKSQICLKTYEKITRPLNRKRLLARVARAIKTILEKLAKEQQNQKDIIDLSFKWTIGDGPGKVGINDLHILSLHNVSRGTW